MIRATKRVNPPAPYDKLDAYELPDGGIVLSSRGAVDALKGGGSKHGAIERYAGGMIEERGGIELRFLEFEAPDGAAVCRGLMLSEFVEIVQWYAERFALGGLRKNQVEIGGRCSLMQSVAASLGWETMARSWFGRTLPVHEVPILQAEYLRRELMKWSQFYPWELPEALARFFGVAAPLDRTRSWPQFMASVHRDLYDILLGRGLAEDARARRDDLGADTIPQVLVDELRDAIRARLPMLLMLAEFSDSYPEWKQRVAITVRKRRENETPFGERSARSERPQEPSRQITFGDILQ